MVIQILLTDGKNKFLALSTEVLSVLAPNLLVDESHLAKEAHKNLETDQSGIILANGLENETPGVNLLERLEAKGLSIPQLSKAEARKYLFTMLKSFRNNHSGTGKIWFFLQTSQYSQKMET